MKENIKFVFGERASIYIKNFVKKEIYEKEIDAEKIKLSVIDPDCRCFRGKIGGRKAKAGVMSINGETLIWDVVCDYIHSCQSEYFLSAGCECRCVGIVKTDLGGEIIGESEDNNLKFNF